MEEGVCIFSLALVVNEDSNRVLVGEWGRSDIQYYPSGVAEVARKERRSQNESGLEVDFVNAQLDITERHATGGRRCGKHLKSCNSG
jgi:hypothetical protein